MANSELRFTPIMELPADFFNNILQNRFGRLRSPLAQQVSKLKSGEGFFVISEEPRTFSEVYKINPYIAVRRGEYEGKLGYWLLCCSPD